MIQYHSVIFGTERGLVEAAVRAALLAAGCVAIGDLSGKPLSDIAALVDGEGKKGYFARNNCHVQKRTDTVCLDCNGGDGRSLQLRINCCSVVLTVAWDRPVEECEEARRLGLDKIELLPRRPVAAA